MKELKEEISKEKKKKKKKCTGQSMEWVEEEATHDSEGSP